ncbi:AAA family ATPase [Paracoccus sp. Z118]|uniref:AAA family ATPase n=1 Tax=Paracoccus sp. Z118 TaxID=2851017 RepID=UPI001C2B833C|nr:AAA family ATPase [Paracoccus sp. Z118]MBV0892786.1 AAA family ATPase [Paracoccus sp. Z118]
MKRIPVIQARFFNPDETRVSLEMRFSDFLLRRRRRNPDLPVANEKSDDGLDADHSRRSELRRSDVTRIQRRAQFIIDRRQAASGLSHLKKEDRERLESLRGGATLISINSEHEADELAAKLHEEMPWMAPATELAWRAMRRSVREGASGLTIPPMLLDGPAGIGKSHWARRLGELIGTPSPVIEATTENASFGMVGSQRGWSGAYPGRLVETIIRARVANPVVIIDEVEKAGQPTSRNGQSFGLAEALLPLLEPLSAKNWSCPYYQVRFDVGWVTWVLTSNDSSRLPAPLLSRCPPLKLRNLSQAELINFVRRQGGERNLSDASIDAIVEALDRVSHHESALSLRVAQRLLLLADDLESGPVRH